MIVAQAARFAAAHSSDVALSERDMPANYPTAFDLLEIAR
jgi:hypothetical protein